MVSKTISIASVPSIMGFLSFVPTKYIGLSELGIISAIGLIVGLLVNIIFLPSIYLIMNVTKRSDIGNIQKFWYSFGKFILEKKVYFLSFLFIITIFNCMFFKSIVFDSDAMKVKDQTLQSVILAKELIAKNPTSDYIISILVDEKINKDDLDKLLNDPNIKRVKSLENIFTDYRSENLDYLKFLLQTGLSKEFYSQPKEIKRFSKLLENIVSLKLIKLSEVTDSLAKEISNVDLTPANIKIIENLLFSNFNELNDTIISIGNKKHKYY